MDHYPKTSKKGLKTSISAVVKLVYLINLYKIDLINLVYLINLSNFDKLQF